MASAEQSEKGPQSPTGRGVRYGWQQLGPFLPRRAKTKVAFVGVLSFVGGIAESLVLVLLTLTADGLIRNTSGIEFGPLELTQRGAVGIALILVFVRVSTIFAAAIISSRFAADTMKAAQFSVASAYLRSSYEARSARPPGDLAAVVVNHGRFTGDLAAAYAILITSVCGVLAFGGTSLVVNPLATLGIAAIGLIVLASIQPLRRRSRTMARAFAKSSRVLGRDVTEVESLQREIELFRVEDAALERVADQAYKGAEELRRVRFLALAIPQLFQAAMLSAAVVSLLLIVGNVDGDSLASVGAVVLLLIRSMSSAQQYVIANQRVIEQTSYAESVNEVVAPLTAARPTFGETRPGNVTPLELRDVRFSYDGLTNVLRDVELSFREGELVGIVGPSGAGKSTLVELLLRLRQPSGGKLVGGGVDWQSIDPEEFSRRVAFVPQQAVLIAGTVAENVDLFRGLPEESITRAIKAAHLEAEVAALPDGIHTRLGPDDRALSGGQRQRLTIARALAGDPDVLILDEPTSALDALSENAIRETLSELPTGRLVILVAHRFSTLRSCSRIVVLDHGRVEMDATPEEVARDSDFFRTMVNEGRNDAG